MKIRTLITMSILAASLSIAPIALCQRPGGGGAGKNSQQGQFANLSPDERTKLKNARQQAMQDSQVQAAREKMKQARKELHDAMQAAMLKADPSVKSILDKMPKQEGPGHQEE